MAKERGRDVKGSVPVLPLPSSAGEVVNPEQTADEWAYSQRSGQFYPAVKDGEWLIIPLDKSGLPIYIPQWMLDKEEQNLRKKSK